MRPPSPRPPAPRHATLTNRSAHADIWLVVRRSRQLLLLVTLLGVLGAALLPAVALACPIPIRRIGPLEESRADLVKPTPRVTTREAWRLDSSWASTRPRLSQFVIVRKVGTFHGVTFKQQQSISIDAYGPEDNGWMYFDDDDPATKPCEVVGQIKWQAPRIRVSQGRTEVRIAATSQRIVGDTTGCILGADFGVRECPNLTRTIVQLNRPLGNRKLVLEVFA